ncbi:MAG TPA: hypothetical protein VNM14_12910 [Planctomycetota bacterium]|jgi:hypothetical protein|nr:hypothetical protein [Planctomycetota bacterium]
MASGGRVLAMLGILASFAAISPLRALQDTDERAIRSLVEQLDAEDPSQRDKARQELLRKGRNIAPLLKSILKDSSGEVAGQLRTILTRFERDELFERSLPPLRTVSIPKGKLMPEEIFRKIHEQTGYRVAPYGMNLRVPMDAGWERAPVLQVLDEVCRRLGRGRPEPPPLKSKRSEDSDAWSERRSEPRSSDRIDVNGDVPLLSATAHYRQFRAAVSDIVITEQRSLSAASTQAVLQLSLSAQPGTHPIDVSPLEVQEITDDSGASLKGEEDARAGFRNDPIPDVGESPDAVWFHADRWGGGGEAPSISIHPPAPKARRIARLRVSVRASFAAQELTRTAPVAEIKEKGSVTLDFGAAGIIVSRAETKDGNFSLHFQMRGSPRGTPVLVLLDKDGAELRNLGGGSSSNGADHQQSWHLRGAPEVSAIRASAWVGHTTIEIPFEFTDVPLPGEK